MCAPKSDGVERASKRSPSASPPRRCQGVVLAKPAAKKEHGAVEVRRRAHAFSQNSLRNSQLFFAAEPWHSFTNAERSAPVSFFSSACLLQALSDMCFAGAAEPAAGASAAKAADVESSAVRVRA